MTVKFWDGTEQQVGTRNAAVAAAKVGLQGWMEPGDYIGHYNSKTFNDGQPDTYVVVCGATDEETDAFARLEAGVGDDIDAFNAENLDRADACAERSCRSGAMVTEGRH